MVKPKMPFHNRVGTSSFFTVVKSGPALRCGANWLTFWETAKGELVHGDRCDAIPLWEVFEKLPTVKVEKGALDEPSYLLEYSDVLRGMGIIMHPRQVAAVGSDKVLLPPETLVYGKLDPDAGRIFVTPREPCFVASSEFVPVEVSSDRARRSFVKAVLLLPEVSAALNLLKAGKCQQRADIDKLIRCSIPLPSLIEQE